MKSQPIRVVFRTFLRPYAGLILLLAVITIFSNLLNLAIPRLIGFALDTYQQSGESNLRTIIIQLSVVSVGILILSFIQFIVSAYVSEKVARDYRQKLVRKVTEESYSFITARGVSNLLTNITSDVDAIKNLISQGVLNLISAAIVLVGSVVLLLTINLRLGLIAISILPFIIITFATIFRKISTYFRLAQENLGKINQVINESVIGAMLIRVLNSQDFEQEKFEKVNKVSRDIGFSIINNFSALIPIVNLVSNIATLLIIWFGGNLVVNNQLTLGEFSAFISYYNLLITPIFILGFISNLLSRSLISLGRINEVLDAEEPVHNASTSVIKKEITGKLEFRDVSLEIHGRKILSNISFIIQPNTRNAILGPTAAGKTQIFSLVTGLVKPTSGSILIDDAPIDSYDKETLFRQLGLVFQDSIVFHTTLRENILFKEGLNESNLEKAISTSALEDLVNTLPQGLDTLISERGSNLSGGQKQRLMLARSLALNPKLLLLDDFTARVDIQTEQTILSNLQNNYPSLTLISITQKIAPIQDYDQILLLMEGELLMTGTHQELMEHSLEYKQIWESQQDTE